MTSPVPFCSLPLSILWYKNETRESEEFDRTLDPFSPSLHGMVPLVTIKLDARANAENIRKSIRVMP